MPVKESREYRKVPEESLMARLGLTRYDKNAPLDETLVPVPKVRILLSQHIGAPAQAIVKAGDQVDEGSDDRSTCKWFKCRDPCIDHR